MSMEAVIRERLETAFDPSVLRVVNESAQHAGHAGDDGSGESHWHVAITAPVFQDESRVARHRMVHKALGDVMDRIHALSLDIAA